MGEPAHAGNDAVVVWRPQPGPQTALLRCPVFEVFYGGARGGGKTDGMLGDFIGHGGRYGGDAIGLMVRRERTQLIETIERSRQIFTPLGAKFNETDKLWRFPNGARLRFAYLENDSDAESYQGHSYSRVYVEEVGNFPTPQPVMKLMGTLRSPAGVPCGIRATGNPGGPGHHWVKARYIDQAPMGWKITTSEYRNPWTGETISRDRVFIPAKLTDNKFLGAEYVANLQMVGSQELVRAWLEGDWTVIEGAFFPEFSIERHVLEPFTVPVDWVRFRAMDWGSAAPLSVGWYAIVQDDFSHCGRTLPRGAVVKYREWYGASAPNVGLKLTAEEAADGIKERENGETIKYGVLDPSAFAQDGGPSIAERMMKRGVNFRQADNRRVAQHGALGGWDQLRARLKGDVERPMIYFFATCRDTIRTLPALQHDDDRAEDVDTDGEDHAADETRYACMSRPLARRVEVKPPQPRLIVGGPSTVTIDDLWKDHKRRGTRI